MKNQADYTTRRECTLRGLVTPVSELFTPENRKELNKKVINSSYPGNPQGNIEQLTLLHADPPLVDNSTARRYLAIARSYLDRESA